MAMKQTRLYFEDLAARLKVKFSISRVWFISLNVADGTLIIWKHADPDPVQCSILLKCISNTSKILEVLAMMEGEDVHFCCDQRPPHETNWSQLLERECIKRALSSGVFGVLQKDVASYLPHPEASSTSAPSKAAAATVETDSEEEREIARDVKASQRHEAERMVEAKAAKSAKSGKDKGKTVVKEAPKKNLSVPSQAPREKLLGSSIAVEHARVSRESKTDTGKRKRESQVTPPPPLRVPVIVAAETSEDEDNISSDKDQGDTTDSGSDSPVQSQLVNKKGSKLKTLKQMDKSNQDREKHDIRRRAVERCRVSAVPIVIPLEQLMEPTLE
ncbi:hypothetical protein R1sor_019464 [Riccia sorocarpa]|uniref:Uncharacterized protein n=1 Tax=Riccia sorocarpa TaxID=122646 RepID=A0ABD3IGV3_9MARC